MKKLLFILLPLSLICNSINAKKPKLARSVWFLLERQDEKQKQPNDSVVTIFKILDDRNDGNLHSPYLLITIYNQSERTIYVDKQKSFIVLNSEMYSLYSPSTEISTQGSTSMGGVGLGIVGVGSASSDYHTTVKHEQRFLTIPSESKTTIETELFSHTVKLNNHRGKISDEGNGNLSQDFVYIGDVLSYNDSDTPLDLDFRICYSFDEDAKTNFVNRSVYYTKTIVGSTFSIKKIPLDITSINAKDKQFATKICPSIESYLSDSNKQIVILTAWFINYYTF